MTKEQAAQSAPLIPRALLLLVGMASAWLALQGMQETAPLIVPVFLALNLLIAVHPVGAFFTKRGVPVIFGALLNMMLVLVALFSFFAIIGWAIAQLVAKLPEYSGEFNALLSDIFDQLGRLGMGQEQINDWVSKFDASNIMGVLNQALSSVSSVSGLLGTAVAVLIFFALDSLSLRDRLSAVAVRHPGIAEALLDFSHSVRTYWIVTTLFGAVVAAIDGVALWLLGVPMPAVWAVLLFLANYIPNIGFIFAMVPPTLMALFAQGVPTAVAVVAVCTGVAMVLQGLVQPRVTGKAVGVNASVSFLSVMFWSWVLGAAGALLSVPMTLFVKSLLVDADPRARWFNAFLAADPSPEEAKSTSDV
ncbi:AI-2E family transporter [Dermabacteraceae bacterium TAE3-ERU27]|nr:AI-2E family transporter [Dermabacteraceae bacterium TAE3-ERU27]